MNNTTYNATTPDGIDVWDSVQKDWSSIGIFSFGIPVIVVNVIGNTLTILAFALDPRLRECNQNVYIINLALADLAAGLIAMPFAVHYTRMHFYWNLGPWTCKFFYCVYYWSAGEVGLTLILVSYDRMIMIRDGDGYDVAEVRKKAFRNIAITWVLAFLGHIPAIFAFDYLRGTSILHEGECKPEFYLVTYYHKIVVFIEFLIPVVSFGTFYVMLATILAKRTKALKEISPELTKNIVLRKEKELATGLWIMIGLYLLCWLPYSVYHMVGALCFECQSTQAYQSVVWTHWFSSALNPFHYAYHNARFRAHYKRMLLPCVFSYIPGDNAPESRRNSVQPAEERVSTPGHQHQLNFELNIPEIEELSILPEEARRQSLERKEAERTKFTPLKESEETMLQVPQSRQSMKTSQSAAGHIFSHIYSSTPRPSVMSHYYTQSFHWHHHYPREIASSASMHRHGRVSVGMKPSIRTHRSHIITQQISQQGVNISAVHKPSSYILELLDFELGGEYEKK